MQELLLILSALLHKLLRVPKDAHDRFLRVPSSNFGPKKTGFTPKFSSDIRSADGKLFIGPHQSLPEMSDGPTAIGEHWDPGIFVRGGPGPTARNPPGQCFFPSAYFTIYSAGTDGGQNYLEGWKPDLYKNWD